LLRASITEYGEEDRSEITLLPGEYSGERVSQ